ncbi:MAG: hypothetical protein ACKVPX_10485 [Myxococcaceae bacterium]
MESAEFEQLVGACTELAQMFPDGLVFIGGIAVHLHVTNTASVRDLSEFTHDADFYISLADMGDLRDIEEVTPNRRLSKHQLIKRGFEFDVYTERQSNLIVPYDAVRAHAVLFEPFRVASLEHLLVLKLEAFRDRRQSAKGEKDAKDLVRIACVAQASKRAFDPSLAAPYLSDDHVELLELVRKGPAAVSMARGNAVLAKKLRAAVERVSTSLKNGR